MKGARFPEKDSNSTDCTASADFQVLSTYRLVGAPRNNPLFLKVAHNVIVLQEVDIQTEKFTTSPHWLSDFPTSVLKGIYPEFQVIRGFSQKIPAGLLSYDQIHS